ncbi:kinase-like domain-containing protein [Mycena leptocephala]|nr:kinase-like domain-containing protein [Mycena leptocephala]
MSSASNTVPCGGYDNVHEGCQEIFPRATPSNLCQKCKKVRDASTPALREELMRVLKSCEGCGVCGTNLSNASCGTCRRKDAMEGGGEDPLLLGKQQRLEKLQKSIGMSGRPGALHDVSNQTFGLTTPVSELEALRGANQKGSWTIFATPRREKALDKSMGNVTKGFTDVLVTIVQQFNLEWVAMPDHVLDLQAKDCSLRFTGNIAIEPEAMAMTVQDMYTFYQKLPHRHLVVETKLKLPKGTSMSFELAISEKKASYNRRAFALSGDDVDSILGSGNKRKSSQQHTGSNGKRAKTGLLTSTFNNDDDLSALTNKPETFKVKFETVTCEPRGNEGGQSLSKNSDLRTGEIEVKPLILSLRDRGKSKDVHKLRIDGDKQIYVAKKLIDIGQGRAAEVSHTTARDLLGRDLVRLTRMGSFRDEFFKFASEKGINELADFVISKGFIILVMAAEEEDEAEPEPYLVEPLRTSSVVQKFTGTFGSTQDTDKLSATILTFSHFVLQQTACRLAMADIQGSFHTVERVRQLVLFDPMTHTIDGKSGIGDHGCAGIRDAIDTHTCTVLCRALGLSSVDVLAKTLDASVNTSESESLVDGYDSP